jgi:uncharacterized protein with PQ loop repeat
MKNKVNNAIGWLGAQMLAFCGVPALVQVVSQGHAEGYSGAFLGLWLGGEIFTLIYVLNQKKLHYPLIFNYLVNIILISVIVYYKI